MPRITDLPPANTLTGSEVLPLDQAQDGTLVTSNVTLTAIASYVANSLDETVDQVTDTTVDAAPVVFSGVPILPTSGVGAVMFSGSVIAQNQATGACKIWTVLAAVEQSPEGAISWIGNPEDGSQAQNPSVSVLLCDVSMADCTLAVNLVSSGFELVGTGLDGATISWVGNPLITGVA